MAKKILITGCEGFLGSNIVSVFAESDYEILGTSLEIISCNQNLNYRQCDLTNIEFTRLLINDFNPDIIVNTVAWPDVDGCENNPDLAHQLNVLTAENVAKSIIKNEIKLIHISSDQLFEGNRSYYSEMDIPKPLNVYGVTKLAAERTCLNNHSNTIVIRTNFFGWSPEQHKPTFAEWIYNSLIKKIQIKMFIDLFFTPIEVTTFVKSIEHVFKSNYFGLLNIAGSERISKYDFGIKLAEEFNLDKNLIIPCSMNNFSFSAPRQPDMSLSEEKFSNLSNYSLPNIRESLSIFHKNQKY